MVWASDPELTGVEGLVWPEGFFPAREGPRVLLDIAPLQHEGKLVFPGNGKQQLGDFGVSLSSWCIMS